MIFNLYCHLIILLVLAVQCNANLAGPIGGEPDPPTHLNLTVPASSNTSSSSSHMVIMGAPTPTTRPTFTNPVLFGATTAPTPKMVTGPIASINSASLLSVNTTGLTLAPIATTAAHSVNNNTLAGTTAHGALTTLPPGTTVHGAVTPVGTTPLGSVTTVPLGNTGAHTVVNVTVPGTTAHGSSTTVPPGITAHSAVNVTLPGPVTVRLGTTAHRSLTTITPGPTIHGAGTPTGTTSHGPFTTVHPGTTPHGAVTQNPYCSSEEALTLAGTCFLSMEYISGKLETMTNGNILDAKSILDVNGYCDTFKTCFAVLEPCGDFNDTNAVAIVNEFCSFYHFFTSNCFLECTKIMESVDATEQKCITNVSAALLDFNATLVSRCSRAMTDVACSVVEVNKYCSEMTTQRYQIFVNRHLQKWNC